MAPSRRDPGVAVVASADARPPRAAPPEVPGRLPGRRGDPRPERVDDGRVRARRHRVRRAQDRASSRPSTTTPATGQFESFANHVNVTNLDDGREQLPRPRPHRHRRRPAVRHGRPQLHLRQLRLRPRPARRAARSCPSGGRAGGSTTTARAGRDGPAGRHRLRRRHPGLPDPGGVQQRHAVGLGRRGRRAAARRPARGSGRVHAVRQPRLRRRGVRAGRPALRLGRRRRQLRQPRLRPGRQPLRRPRQRGWRPALPGHPDLRRPARARRHHLPDQPERRRGRRPAPRPTRRGSSPTASATRGGSPSGRAPPSCGPPTWARAAGRRSTAPTCRRSRHRSTSAGPATRAPTPACRSRPAGTRSTSRSARTSTPQRPAARARSGRRGSATGPVAVGTRSPPGRTATQGTSSISGVAFIPTTSNYPAQYRGAMFFNDFARVVHLVPRQEGERRPGPDPDPAVRREGRDAGPDQGRPGRRPLLRRLRDRGRQVTGGAGAVHRIVYTTGNQPAGRRVTATPSSGPAPLDRRASTRAGSTDPDGDALTYEWDLDGDGTFDDGGGVTQSRTYSTPGNVTVTVRVSDGRGGTDTEHGRGLAGQLRHRRSPRCPPARRSPGRRDRPSTCSATATDAQQTLPDSAFVWSVVARALPERLSHPPADRRGRPDGLVHHRRPRVPVEPPASPSPSRTPAASPTSRRCSSTPRRST